MKQITVYCIFLFFVVSLLPGCVRIAHWGKSILYQGENRDAHIKSMNQFIQSVTVYDQLLTRAIFDVLWLSDDVRNFYSDLHVYKLGKISEQEAVDLRKQREENDRFICFYVLSLHGVPLSDDTAEWGVFLQVDDKIFAPVEFKVIELPVEYQKIFGALYTRFKVAYSLKFDAVDRENNPIITPQAGQLTLCFRAIDKETKLVWPLAVGSI